MVKNPLCDAGDLGSTLGWVVLLEGAGNPLSIAENPTDRNAWYSPRGLQRAFWMLLLLCQNIISDELIYPDCPNAHFFVYFFRDMLLPNLVRKVLVL